MPFVELLLILASLWLIDMFQTLGLTRYYGVKVEGNPFARFLLKHKDADFIAFKILDLLVLGVIMVFIKNQQAMLADSLLFVFIMLYLFTVLHNHRIIVKDTGAKSFVELYTRKHRR